MSLEMKSFTGQTNYLYYEGQFTVRNHSSPTMDTIQLEGPGEVRISGGLKMRTAYAGALAKAATNFFNAYYWNTTWSWWIICYWNANLSLDQSFTSETQTFLLMYNLPLKFSLWYLIIYNWNWKILLVFYLPLKLKNSI